ncbi:hypothetical protein C7999DRAFT_18009 [Corynascus novoguineensis]|uniref:WW domain-containing protein n=1 Tax=Corynascus novoguineensis TaxID=1126955 RepID=A0AAN7CKD3_9PEZI|nr:hypothetical protein C7999DRAFT_18009 [Corynascus novoguineensis]
MVKSTYQPPPSALPPLPPGWTEHKAPTGHTYYYNAETKESTYKRPGVAPVAPIAAPAAAPIDPAMSSYVQHQMVPQINLSDPAVANAFMAQYGQQQLQQQGHRGGFGGGARGGFQARPRPQPVDKPRSKVAIPGCEPWILVYTKYGRRFAYNPVKNASYWRIPEKLMPAILELDTARIREKAEGKKPEQGGEDKQETRDAEKTGKPAGESEPEEAAHDYDSSEYEEVEVTDDEGAADDDQDQDGGMRKRQRTEEPSADDGPAEFTEADIAAQLAAMNAEYNDTEMGEGGAEWEEGDEGLPLSDEDARELFKDLLNDFRINPYSSWDKLLEEGKVFDDARYSILPTTKARKEVWEEWSRAKIQELKERRAKEEKKDPRIPYLAFLQEKATPKLYWPEFRRKYKREEPMKSTKLSDKDREKWYREHINRLKLPQATLKSDLKKLLESVPLSALNNQTMVSNLPAQVLADIRYISLDPKVRDPFVEAYIQGLGPPPEAGETAEQEDEAAKKAREERRKRERALEERERVVAEEKRRQEKKMQYERAKLREEEREIERAMHVGKKGLQSQLVGDKA